MQCKYNSRHATYKKTYNVLPCTGAVITKTRYDFMNKDWKAAVRREKIRSKKIVDGSECCQLCREKFPETKVWQKFKFYSTCDCFIFDDDFDPTKYEKKHGAYSIGSCK